MAFAFFLACFLVLFAIGMPVPFAMISSSWLYTVIIGRSLSLFSINLFNSLDSFILIAVPMFILAAEVMNSTTIADRIFNFANSVVGPLPGGLGHVNVVTSIIFSGMSGSAAADAGGIGFLSYRSMVDRGFPRSFSAAVTASSACIGPIIPPSIPMVVYAMVANASIGRLFLGGVFPGLLMGVGLMGVVFLVSKRRGYPTEQRVSLLEVARHFVRSFLALLTPLILLGSIASGMVTVTEAAVVAVFYSAVLGGILYRLLGPKALVEILKKVVISCGVVAIFFPAGRVFGHILTVEGLPTKFASLLLGITEDPLLIILTINAFFLILGCLSDPLINIMLFVPITLPLVMAAGFDPVHYGVMIVLNTMIGLITPPMGGMVFIISGVGKVPVEDIIGEIWPFIAVLILVLIVIVLLPEVVLYLPSRFF
jgi:tripartite ATP-independent transporter DctM subunit